MTLYLKDDTHYSKEVYKAYTEWYNSLSNGAKHSLSTYNERLPKDKRLRKKELSKRRFIGPQDKSTLISKSYTPNLTIK